MFIEQIRAVTKAAQEQKSADPEAFSRKQDEIKQAKRRAYERVLLNSIEEKIRRAATKAENSIEETLNTPSVFKLLQSHFEGQGFTVQISPDREHLRDVIISW